MSQDKDKSKQPNRRSSRRLAPKVRVKIQCRNALDLGANFALKVVDLSDTGAKLIVSQAHEKGQEITLSLDSPAQPKSLRLKATVMWSKPAEDGTFEIGVNFSTRVSYRDLTNLGAV